MLLGKDKVMINYKNKIKLKVKKKKSRALKAYIIRVV